MTVKELIDELSKIDNQDMDVVIKGTGPDEWVYMNDVEGYYETLVMNVDGEGLCEVDKDDVDEDDDVFNVFVIDGGMF
jgi:hypothetical protein